MSLKFKKGYIRTDTRVVDIAIFKYRFSWVSSLVSIPNTSVVCTRICSEGLWSAQFKREVRGIISVMFEIIIVAVSLLSFFFFLKRG